MISVSYLSGSGSGSPKSLQTGCWLALHHLKAWLGVGSLPLLAWCTGWSLGVLSYFHVDLFPGYLSILISVWLASPRVSDPREGKAVFHTFYNLALEIAHISSVLPYFIGHSDQPDAVIQCPGHIPWRKVMRQSQRLTTTWTFEHHEISPQNMDFCLLLNMPIWHLWACIYTWQ